MFTKEKFFKKYEKVPVVEYHNKISKNPLVSVCVQTYQQVNYISQCLDGILLQKTNFNFEILLGEDASTDGTREICIEYAKKYPNKIRLFLHKRENNIVVYDKPTSVFNFRYNAYNSRGKYLALCEGDDYWIDPFKLQKQIDFLEKNSDYGMIFSDIIMIDGDGKEMPETNFHKKIRKLYKSGNIFWSLIQKNFINTLTTCTKKDIIIDYMNRFPDEDFVYDYRTWLHVATCSKIKFVNEKWAAYRNHTEGVSKDMGFFKKRTPLVLQAALVHYLKLNRKRKNKIDDRIASNLLGRIFTNRNLSFSEKGPTIKMLIKRPVYSLNIIKLLFQKLGNKRP